MIRYFSLLNSGAWSLAEAHVLSRLMDGLV
jgi:hypothetical protein